MFFRADLAGKAAQVTKRISRVPTAWSVLSHATPPDESGNCC
jgi:hypothetical protein